MLSCICQDRLKNQIWCAYKQEHSVYAREETRLQVTQVLSPSFTKGSKKRTYKTRCCQIRESKKCAENLPIKNLKSVATDLTEKMALKDTFHCDI